MKSVSVLDCTLRDGGYVNDWNFGFGSIKSIISRLAKAKIDIIEVGFIDENHAYNQDRSIYPDSNSIKPVLENIDVQDSMIVAMIDFGTCSLDKITLQKDSCLDGIRVIFKKKDQDAAIEYMNAIKEKGYKVFVNPVSATGYSEHEALTLIKKIIAIDPYTVTIVDTYGLMHGGDAFKYYKIYDENINPGTIIAYHAHNNFQLAYSNSIHLINNKTDRPLVVDSSLYGMGKSAGNTSTELLTMYLNENNGSSYDIDQILEAIDVDIMKEFNKQRWGYSLPYYIAALNDCHPDYVKHLLNKKTLAVKTVNEILIQIPSEMKLSFKKILIESLYSDFQDKYFNDKTSYENLTTELAGKPILLLGPGGSLVSEADRISTFIETKKPLVFSINFINDQFPIDYVFMGNAKRYSQFFHKIYGEIQKCKVICTSNISESGKNIDYKFNYGTLSLDIDSVSDNPLLMLLQILMKCKCQEVYLAGFDGYSQNGESNYYKEYIPYLYCDVDLIKRNDIISLYLNQYQEKIKIKTLTKSEYFKN